MSDQGLRITDVVESIRKHRVMILIISFAAAVAGAVFHLAGPKKFEGRTEFVLRNAMYADRNYIYNTDTKLLDYFANEDDIDRAMMMVEADIVQWKVIQNMNLAKAYGLDISSRKGAQQLGRKFSKNFNITRTEFKSLVLTYLDEDAERAAAVANECVKVLEEEFSGYYKEMRRGMYQSIVDRIREEDTLINTLTDSVISVRERYAINDLVNPARYNLMLSGTKENGRKDYARGLEMIQNIESINDELVTNRARQTSLANQYLTGINSTNMPVLKVVTVARPSVSPKGIGGMYTVLACAFLGFFFCTAMVSLADHLKKQGRSW